MSKKSRRHLLSIKKKSHFKRIIDGVKAPPPPPSMKAPPPPRSGLHPPSIKVPPPSQSMKVPPPPPSMKAPPPPRSGLPPPSIKVPPPSQSMKVPPPPPNMKVPPPPLSGLHHLSIKVSPSPPSMKVPPPPPSSMKVAPPPPSSMKEPPPLLQSIIKRKLSEGKKGKKIKTIVEEEKKTANSLKDLMILENTKSGIKNLGNICFCSSVIQLLRGMGIYFKTDKNILNLIKIQFPGYENSQEDASELLEKILYLMKIVNNDKYNEYTFGFETSLFYKLNNKYEKIIKKIPNIVDYTMFQIDSQYINIEGISYISQIIDIIVNKNYEKNDQFTNMPDVDDLEDKSILDRIPNTDNMYQSYNKYEYKIPLHNKYIIIHLKLFDFDSKSLSTSKIDKIIYPDNIIINNVNNVKYEYEPKSIIYHTGRYGRGHYTNSTKYDSDWYYFDDDKKIKKYKDYNQMLEDAKNDKNQFSKTYPQFTPYIILYKKI